MRTHPLTKFTIDNLDLRLLRLWQFDGFTGCHLDNAARISTDKTGLTRCKHMQIQDGGAASQGNQRV